LHDASKRRIAVAWDAGLLFGG